VVEQALNAAFEDPRFAPLDADELPLIKIEISALTPPHPVPSYRDIVIGKHGMVLRKGVRSAVFLPQVAPEQGWGSAYHPEPSRNEGRPAGRCLEARRRFHCFRGDCFQRG
jgi:AMMECR1 domain-containing protein